MDQSKIPIKIKSSIWFNQFGYRNEIKCQSDCYRYISIPSDIGNYLKISKSKKPEGKPVSINDNVMFFCENCIKLHLDKIKPKIYYMDIDTPKNLCKGILCNGNQCLKKIYCNNRETCYEHQKQQFA